VFCSIVRALQHQKGRGWTRLESTLCSLRLFRCSVIVPFRSHEWDRLVSGVELSIQPGHWAGSNQGTGHW